MYVPYDACVDVRFSAEICAAVRCRLLVVSTVGGTHGPVTTQRVLLLGRSANPDPPAIS